MTRAPILIAFIAGLLLPLAAPASAADMSVHPRISRSHVYEPVLPFPRSERAQSVWASNACFTDCNAVTTWDQAACLKRDSQGTCLQRADSGDRSCQRQCRTSGGPWLPLDF